MRTADRCKLIEGTSALKWEDAQVSHEEARIIAFPGHPAAPAASVEDHASALPRRLPSLSSKALEGDPRLRLSLKEDIGIAAVFSLIGLVFVLLGC